MTFHLIGDYRYSGATDGNRKFSIVRNGDELQRVREILPTGHPVLWEAPAPMTPEVLSILRHETSTVPATDSKGGAA